MTAPVIVLFRRDLRLDDNPALSAACRSGAAVFPVYVMEEGPGLTEGSAARWWLHHSLASLHRALASHGLSLHLARGDTCKVVPALVSRIGARRVFWNRRYEPAGVACDTRLKALLGELGVDARSMEGNLLHDPLVIRNKQGTPFQVFTPFWRHCLDQEVGSPVPFIFPCPEPGAGIERIPGLCLEDLQLLPTIPWADRFQEAGEPGEEGALRRVRRFLLSQVSEYDQSRDVPSLDGTSRLSAHLHFGEIGVRRLNEMLREPSRESGIFPSGKGQERFLAELGWRDFAAHLLFHYPHTLEHPLREQFVRFPWRADPGGRLFTAWTRGRTGYPIVDAGMRQLWATGWMHNRVRMVVASFLVKHLRLKWQDGAQWFMDTLVDADPASNTLGWQWAAGCGADAAPYFRIFNPILQGEKFDAQGDYVRTWVPELSRLPGKYVHKPWTAPSLILAQARVVLGRDYPLPVVDHAQARSEALQALASLKD